MEPIEVTKAAANADIAEEDEDDNADWLDVAAPDSQSPPQDIVVAN